MRALEKCPTCGHVLKVEHRPLTPRQHQVLELIRMSVSARGFAPTQAEMGRELGLRSAATIYELVRTLEAKGYIRVEFNLARGITLLEESATAPAVAP